jgi:DNA-binding response OmpR family regulator
MTRVPPHTSVLLVDDDSAIRTLIKIYLQRDGIPVVDAASGEEALGLFLRDVSRFSLLITDVIMPGMSGRDLAARLREHRPDFPVLLISGYCDELPAEPDGLRCFQKPLDFNELLAEVAALAGCDLSRCARELAFS